MDRSRSTGAGGRNAAGVVVTVGAFSDVGMARSSNQDSFCALVGADAPSGMDALLAVADGMGGHRAGDVASEMAIHGLVDGLSRDAGRTGVDGLAAALRRTVGQVNAEVHAAAGRPETRGMGTTLTAAVLAGGALAIAHVGDSRAYLLRRGALRQLTQDHSWVAERVAEGVLSPADAEGHPWSNILTRAIGVDPRVEVDGAAEDLEEGDLLLLCSDGLYSMVGHDEIAAVLEGGDPQPASRAMVDLANARGGHDNITVVVARIVSVTPPARPC